jgi:hypothetical protein
VTISSLAAAFIPGYSGHVGGPNGTVTRVVIHGTVSATVRGGARSTAAYFQSANSGGLAHYVVDPGEIIACCDEDSWCWHAPPNPGSIGIELCDVVDGDPARWADADHQAMLALAAALTADICRRRGIPGVHIGASELLGGAHGVAGHVDVSEAWHQSDHHDPGDGFPWDQFISLVNGHASITPGEAMGKFHLVDVCLDPKRPADAKGRLPFWGVDASGETYAFNGARAIPSPVKAGSHSDIVGIVYDAANDTAVLVADDGAQDGGEWAASTFDIRPAA